MSAAELPHEPNSALRVFPWRPWFAWRPVRLYMTKRLVWLKRLHRRCVIKPVGTVCEYTDSPDEFPDLADIKDVIPGPPAPNFPAQMP
ncbi:MAG TPA: hypothetical protein VMU31_00450 [Rhizomicrobium sp.]|nr:hypothetical protein [Rhizomicrobium sp.]